VLIATNSESLPPYRNYFICQWISRIEQGFDPKNTFLSLDLSHTRFSEQAAEKPFPEPMPI
jgi:hypothetical protein